MMPPPASTSTGRRGFRGLWVPIGGAIARSGEELDQEKRNGEKHFTQAQTKLECGHYLSPDGG
jgi:hypothetical protein